MLQSEEVLEFSTALSLFGNVYFPRFEKNGNFWSMKKTMKMNEESGKLREEVYEKNFFQDLGNFFLNYDYTCEKDEKRTSWKNFTIIRCVIRLTPLLSRIFEKLELVVTCHKNGGKLKGNCEGIQLDISYIMLSYFSAKRFFFRFSKLNFPTSKSLLIFHIPITCIQIKSLYFSFLQSSVFIIFSIH